MTITFDITPGRETALRRQAERSGLTLEAYMRSVVEQLADREETPGDGHDGSPKTILPGNRRHAAKRPRRPYNQAGLAAALESFERGDSEEQRQTLESLTAATVLT